VSAEIISFAAHPLRRSRMAYEVTALPESMQEAVLWLLRLYVERRASPSAEVDATIARVEDAIRRDRVHELDPPASLVAH
jgi:hypothetical protein